MTYIFIVFLMWVSPLVNDAIHMLKIKRVYNQKDLKIGNLHFVKSE